MMPARNVPADQGEVRTMNCSFVIEVAPFTLADTVSEEQLLIASEALESDFLSTTDGYSSIEMSPILSVRACR
jgi:hypothetical protein